MTHLERIANLKTLGYTDREAEFLCLAALHSGYFVRRQFLGFTQRERGKLDARLADKAVGSGHAKALEFRHNRTVYSFCSKPFFEAIGEVDNRNRRRHEVFTIKNRLIGLDFVLKHRDRRFFATEREKVSYFRETAGIELDQLPAKHYRAQNSPACTARYFVDKFPIALSPESSTCDSAVEFCYVDEGLHSTSGFRTYVEQYRPLFMRLAGFRLIYVATHPNNFLAAGKVFEKLIGNGNIRIPEDPSVPRLLSYFQARALFERRDMASFDQAKLIRFREDRKSFSGEKFEALFRIWIDGGDAEVLRILSPESSSRSESRCTFHSYLSPFRYELFGTLTDGNRRVA